MTCHNLDIDLVQGVWLVFDGVLDVSVNLVHSLLHWIQDFCCFLQKQFTCVVMDSWLILAPSRQKIESHKLVIWCITCLKSAAHASEVRATLLRLGNSETSYMVAPMPIEVDLHQGNCSIIFSWRASARRVPEYTYINRLKHASPNHIQLSNT